MPKVLAAFHWSVRSGSRQEWSRSPAIFAVVLGPGTVIVDGDVLFEDALDVPAVERVIVEAAAALRRGFPAIAYVYLNPVAQARARKHTSRRSPLASGAGAEH